MQRKEEDWSIASYSERKKGKSARKRLFVSSVLYQVKCSLSHWWILKIYVEMYLEFKIKKLKFNLL